MHKHKLVHEDGKTDNLLMDLKGNLKIIDYGMVHNIGAEYHGGTLFYCNPSKLNGFLKCHLDFYNMDECLETPN